MLATFLTIKVNLSHYSVEDFGFISFVVANLALCAGVRLSGIDISLTRSFREFKHYVSKKSLLLFTLIGAFLSSAVALTLVGLQVQGFSIFILLVLYGFLVSFDRSSSVLLTQKRFILHRSYLLASSVCVLIAAIICKFQEVSTIVYIQYYLVILIFFHAVKVVTTLGFINFTFIDKKYIVAEDHYNWLYHPIFSFSLLGALQAFLGNLDRIIIGFYSKEILGYFVITLIVPNIIRQLLNPLYVKLIYEDFKIFYVKNFISIMVLLMVSVFLLISSGYYIIPLLLNINLAFDWQISTIASVWVFAFLFEAFVVGRLTLIVSAYETIGAVVILTIIQIAIYGLLFLFFNDIGIKELMLTIAIAQLIRTTFLYLKFRPLDNDYGKSLIVDR